MSKLFQGKTVVITGSNRGIGKAILEMFALNGANIIAHSRNMTDEFLNITKGLADEHKIDITPVFFDLRDDKKIDEFVKSIFESKTKVDILVNNAGITHNNLLSMSRVDDLLEQFEVNFYSIVKISKGISRLMTKNKNGIIVNISSTASLDGNIGKSFYGSSKAALNTFTKVLSRELGPYGVRVNAIAPGMTDTTMLGSFSKQIIDETLSNTLTRKLTTPEDIANVVMFLASDMSSYVTGQVIRVDGGMI